MGQFAWARAWERSGFEPEGNNGEDGHQRAERACQVEEEPGHAMRHRSDRPGHGRNGQGTVGMARA
eukprot:82343-Chlamydomonas_euryale.AAC.2